MNKRTKQAFLAKLAKAGFAPWQVQHASRWSGLKRRNWRRTAATVFGVKA